MALLPQDPQQQKKLLIALAPILLVFAYWYFLDGKKQDEIAALELRLEQLETTNAAARAQAQEGPELERKLKIFEQHMARLEQLIPNSEEVPALLHTVTERAQEAGVEFTLLRPETPTPGAFYTKQSYALGISGGYQDIGRFLSFIGSLPRIITPVGLRLSPQGMDPKKNVMRLDAAFRIETYVTPAPGAAAPAAGASGGAASN